MRILEPYRRTMHPSLLPDILNHGPRHPETSRIMCRLTLHFLGITLRGVRSIWPFFRMRNKLKTRRDETNRRSCLDVIGRYAFLLQTRVLLRNSRHSRQENIPRGTCEVAASCKCLRCLPALPNIMPPKSAARGEYIETVNPLSAFPNPRLSHQSLPPLTVPPLLGHR